MNALQQHTNQSRVLALHEREARPLSYADPPPFSPCMPATASSTERETPPPLPHHSTPRPPFSARLWRSHVYDTRPDMQIVSPPSASSSQSPPSFPPPPPSQTSFKIEALSVGHIRSSLLQLWRDLGQFELTAPLDQRYFPLIEQIVAHGHTVHGDIYLLIEALHEIARLRKDEYLAALLPEGVSLAFFRVFLADAREYACWKAKSTRDPKALRVDVRNECELRLRRHLHLKKGDCFTLEQVQVLDQVTSNACLPPF